MNCRFRNTLLAAFVPVATSAFADPVAITAATATRQSESWSISVSLLHNDNGWNHYADGWEVLNGDGDRIGFRELLHPHINEQPFTRSLSGVVVPEGAKSVTIRAHCNVDGWTDETFELQLVN
jgi:hypothetical protein